MTEQAEQRIPLPERTARRLGNLYDAAMAAQSVAQAAAQAATAEASRVASAYHLALATVLEHVEVQEGGHPVPADLAGVRLDRDSGELVLPGTKPPTVEDHSGAPQAER